MSTKGDDNMENVNIVLAANILKYRKKIGLSQEELANKLGVTFQAVSKWENAKAAPDVTFLPIMADIFNCYIDELFSREIKTEIHYDHCAEFFTYYLFTLNFSLILCVQIFWKVIGNSE